MLRELNILLSDEVNRSANQRLENIRLRSMLGLQRTSRVQLRQRAASSGTQMQALRNTVTIDVGDRQRRPDGHAGRHRPRPRRAGRRHQRPLCHRAVAPPQGSPRERPRAAQPGERHHPVERRARPPAGQRSEDLDVQHGDVIITSEYSSLFPGGIRIGVVSATREVPGELFQEVTVQPSVDFARLEEVFVVTVSARLHPYRPRTQEQGMTSAPIMRPALIARHLARRSACADDSHPVHRHRDDRPGSRPDLDRLSGHHARTDRRRSTAGFFLGLLLDVLAGRRRHARTLGASQRRLPDSSPATRSTRTRRVQTLSGLAVPAHPHGHRAGA